MLDEYVSVKAAKEKYGVVLTGSLAEYDLKVDVAATEALRKVMKAAHAANVSKETGVKA